MLLMIYVLTSVEGNTLLITRRMSARMNLELNLSEFSAVLPMGQLLWGHFVTMPLVIYFITHC